MTDLMERMVHFVEDSSLNAGFSRCMNGHMNLRRQYIQAKIALQFGTRKYPDKRMHPFNDISFDYILDQATKSSQATCCAMRDFSFCRSTTTAPAVTICERSAAIWTTTAMSSRQRVSFCPPQYPALPPGKDQGNFRI